MEHAYRARVAEHVTPATCGVDHVGLSVRDLESTRRFFCDCLGWRVVGERPEYPAAFVSDSQQIVTLWRVEAPDQAVAFDRRTNVGLHHLTDIPSINWHISGSESNSLNRNATISVPTYFTIPTNFVGSDYKAIVGYQTRKRVDIEGLTREFGPRLSVLYASHSIASASTSTPASAMSALRHE